MTKKRGSALGVAAATAAFLIGAVALAEAPPAANLDAEPSRYAVTPANASNLQGAPAEYQADNPANNLRFAFPATGLIGRPRLPDAGAWSFDLRLTGVSFDGRFAPVGSVRHSASGNRVDYELGAARVSYVNTPLGLEQRITIVAPESRGKQGALTAIGLELSVDGNLTPVKEGYFIDLVTATGDDVVRFGPVDARGAGGEHLDARVEVSTDGRGSPTGARVIIDAVDPVYPIEVSARMTSRTFRTAQAEARAAVPSTEIVGTPVALGEGITETVDQLMERERLRPIGPMIAPHETHRELELEVEQEEDPNAPPPLSHWPPIAETYTRAPAAPVEPPNLPQTVGTSFKGIGISESGFIPPDSMGDVGPTQILMHVNGRIKVFSKLGVVGPLNVSDASFWATVAPGGISDPQVRYDRLSGRWFVLAISLEATNNQIVIAVSSGATITGAASFTFFKFNIGNASPSDAAYFCDYPGFGIDANAIYTGCNMFGATFHTSAFVIRKSSVLGAGPIVVTGFFGIGSAGSAGPYAPRGVDNDDPSWTQGYIIGTDPGFIGRINIRRVTNPGGAPTLGPNILLSVSNTNMLTQSAMGSTTNVDPSNVRLFAASIHKNKITGVTSLWTAHSVETDTTCTPAASGNNRRIGAKWYEIGSLTTTPAITQFGTLCTTAAGSATSNTERGFLYPTAVATGQGHMALSASHSSATEFIGISAAGRLRTDPAAGTRAPETIVLAGGGAYTQLDNANRNRWGDYSHTDVDPNDDQTVWTFQEYADTGSNNWSVRAVQLKAPPPPDILTTSNPVCVGVVAAPVTVTGTEACAAPTCTNGLCTGGGACPEFFDPGPDTGGPGYANHISATVTGSITVNSASIVIPASPSTQRVLSVTLSLNTTAATPGLKSVTITNPDGQAKLGNNKITVIANRNPVANLGGVYFVCDGGSVMLNGSGSSDPDASCGDSLVSYEWDLNNDTVFDVTGATPTVTYAQLVSLGLVVGPNTIKLRVTDTHSATNTGTGTLTLALEGGGCSDGNGCTQTDTCQSGVCVGSNPVACTPLDQCHDAGVCSPGTGVCSNPDKANGSACSDGNACTLTDSCQTGVCIGANPVNCSDSNACTTDVCDTGTGACSHPNAPDGNPCSDANACTQTDSCLSGVCTGSNPVVCSASDQCHVAGVCNTGTGVCSNPNAPNGTSCNDANACTQTDSCQTGVCTGSNPVVCSASDQCHVSGVCDPGSGVCSNPAAPDATPCNDGDFCTGSDACTAGVCSGTPGVTPGEIQNAHFNDETTLAWDAIPNSPLYDVVRGQLSSLPVGPGGGDEVCFDDQPTSVLVDGTTPAPDTGFWYLTRGATSCGVGTFGTQHNGTPRVTTTCP